MIDPSVATRHECMIYDGAPSRTLPALVACIRRNLAEKRRCMYLNSPAMVSGLRAALYARGTHVEQEVERGALVLGSDTGHLIDGRFSVERMIDMLRTAAAQAVADGFEGLFATGDMTWEFGPERDFSKLVEYEIQLEALFLEQPALSGICQYHRDLLPRETVREGVVSHARMFINDTLRRLNPHFTPQRTVDKRRAAAQAYLEGTLEELVVAPAEPD